MHKIRYHRSITQLHYVMSSFPFVVVEMLALEVAALLYVVCVCVFEARLVLTAAR